jgi:hypothetical protein
MCWCICRSDVSWNDDGSQRRNGREAWKGRNKAKHPCDAVRVAELAANTRFALSYASSPQSLSCAIVAIAYYRPECKIFLLRFDRVQ